MKLVTTKSKSGGLHEKHVVATWNVGNHLSICLQTQGNREKCVCRDGKNLCRDLKQGCQIYIGNIYYFKFIFFHFLSESSVCAWSYLTGDIYFAFFPCLTVRSSQLFQQSSLYYLPLTPDPKLTYRSIYLAQVLGSCDRAS